MKRLRRVVGFVLVLLTIAFTAELAFGAWVLEDQELAIGIGLAGVAWLLITVLLTLRVRQLSRQLKQQLPAQTSVGRHRADHLVGDLELEPAS